MTSAEIRQSFLDFFREKKHTIVPSSSLMPDSPNLLFTNAGMNQFVPIFLGERKADVDSWSGAIKGSKTRAADTQKCIRAGGKHNDLDDVGLDTYHHTFFEMLGNWSFGDYFKKEAIEWAWELVVGRWGFPPERLYATVYKPDKALGDPSEFDQEAHDHWARLFARAGLNPAIHIVNGNKKDNFWMMGDTGPCGPCSELHVDLTPLGDTNGSLVNKGDARCIEIWNLVFIQYNANTDGTFSPLPAKHVDTGMGFERVTSIIQGTKNFTDFANAKISNYETDIFRPIFDELERLSGKKYASTLPGGQKETDSSLIHAKGEATFAEGVATFPKGVTTQTKGEHTQSKGELTRQEGALTGAEGGHTLSKGALTRQKGGDTPTQGDDQFAVDIAFRVIADHIRTLSFAIADGIQPGNTDRNYVLRRILRRAVRYGRTLGFHEPFFYKLVDVLARTMGDVFPEIRAKQAQVKEVLKREEEAFNKTLDNGIEVFNSDCMRLITESLFGKTSDWADRVSAKVGFVFETEGKGFADIVREAEKQEPGWTLSQISQFPAAEAFKLYDTYGFPLDLTELMARERGLTVDVAGFEKLMEEQRARARAAQKKEVISVSDDNLQLEPTKFLGYDFLETEAVVEAVTPGKNEGELNVVLDRTACYAEMGGQVGDHGLLHVPGHDRSEVGRLAVLDTQKRGDVFIHRAKLADGRAPEPGEAVRVAVDAGRRAAIQRHHTVTHLLHWALHEVVSRDASQKGSFVGADKLTFDFNSAALTPAQVADVEKLVNEKIVENAGVSWTEVPYAEVKKHPAIMQFFGDKYGDIVRVVQIGGQPRAFDGYSMELCGGTHTRATGEIGLFKIISEAAIAAGVRRIEAVAGLSAYDFARADSERLKTLAAKLGSPLADLEKRIDSMLAQQKELEKQLDAVRKKQAAADADALVAKTETINTIPAIIGRLGDADGDKLQAIADRLKAQNFQGVLVLVGTANNQVALIASVSPDFTAKIQAGKIIQTIAPIVGGKGGGRPDNARGAGKDASKIDEALAKAKSLLG